MHGLVGNTARRETFHIETTFGKKVKSYPHVAVHVSEEEIYSKGIAGTMWLP